MNALSYIILFGAPVLIFLGVTIDRYNDSLFRPYDWERDGI